MKKNILLSLFVMAFTVFSYAQSTTLKLPTADSTSNFIVTNSNDSTLMRLNGDNGFYLGGTYGTGNLPVTGTGPRVIWYPAKAAFRAGSVSGTQWDDDSIGNHSVAMGYNTTASGIGSIALGYGGKARGKHASVALGYQTTASGESSTALDYQTTASNLASTAMGFQTTASNLASTAMGFQTTASGEGSTAMGEVTTASGHASTAIGDSTIASGLVSTAMGYFTTASGDYSTAMGEYTTASSEYSTAMGKYTTASGEYSTAMGHHTTAQAFSSVTLGMYNVVAGTTGSWVTTDPLFVVGNGTKSSRSNALTVLKNGNTGIGTATPDTTLEVAGLIKITGGSPGTGKVLTSDSAGLATWEAPGTSSFNLDDAYNNGDTITANAGAVFINGTDGFISTGTFGRGDALSVSGAGTRMIWYPKKAAFRAGSVNGTQWDNDSIGNYSTATGENTTASGDYGSTAMGYGTTASGYASTAMGYGPIASGNFSTAMGFVTTASNLASTAMGYQTTASGQSSIAMGEYATASGRTSIAMGEYATASGKFSTATGDSTTANASYSTAMGSNASTGGHPGSFAIGDHSTTTDVVPTHDNQMVMRFDNGYRLFTNSAMTVGIYMQTGDNSWSQISDSTKKYAFLPVNGDSVLIKLNRFNLRSWSYKGQDSTKFRHYGPMAQEFFAAFGHDKYGVAGNDTTINQADFMGINLIAIQALYRKTKKLKSEVIKQKQLIAKLQKTEVESTTLKNKVASLEKALSEQNGKIASQQKFIEKMAGNMTAIASKLKTLEAHKSLLGYNE